MRADRVRLGRSPPPRPAVRVMPVRGGSAERPRAPMSSADAGRHVAVSDLQSLAQSFVDTGDVPGVVALVARGNDVELAAAGSLDLEGSAAMTPDTIFRVASITKPITAAAGMILVDEGRLDLDEPIARWLPELASPVVVRTPSSPVDDVVPAVRPITARDLMTFRAGWGFPSDFSLPAVQPLFTDLRQGPPTANPPPPGEW